MNLQFAIAVVLVLIGPGTTAWAAEPAEPAGPPLSAMPPRAPATRLPPVPPQPADTEAATYERCMKLARDDPAAGRALAQDWLKRGGAHPADHCLAVALIGLKQYKEAAGHLEMLAREMVHAPTSLRAEALGQAAQAWLLAGDPARAYAADGAALAFRPDDADLLVERAEAAGSAGWYDKAIADLDRVLKAHPARFDALLYRASAHRAQDRLDVALADIEAALKLAPDSPPALLERGNIRGLRGDLAGAREDWRRVMALAASTAAGAAAKANIARLDDKGGAPPTPANPAARR
jgi:tetratricopeptide (TPR) repeat protein